MAKKVYLEPPWIMHAYHNRLVAFPPAGYEFVVSETAQEKLFKFVTHWDIPRTLLKFSDLIIPTSLVKSWLEKENKPPKDALLTYACDHLVFRQEPWVVEMEFASFVVGIHPKHLAKVKQIIENALSSPYCRKILCWSEAGRRTLLTDLDPQGFQDKIEVVYYSVPAKHFVKRYKDDKVRLLFVAGGSPTKNWIAFKYKGGLETLEAFKQLCQQYKNLELVVRSEVPPDVKVRYEKMKSLRIIEEYIPWHELEQEFLSADICIMPSHTTIAMTLLDAMSYELPVVTIDSWANAEYVEDGKTGLVAFRSKKVPYYYDHTSQPNFGTAEYNRAMALVDSEVVNELVKKTSLLIENPELRRQLGKAGRWEVENGKFSLAKINTKLKRIFDEASN